MSSDDDNDTRNAGEDGVEDEDEDEKDDDGSQRTTRITSEAFEGKTVPLIVLSQLNLPCNCV